MTRMKEYKRENPQKMREINAAHYAANRERALDYARGYRRTAAGMLTDVRRNAKMRGVS